MDKVKKKETMEEGESKLRRPLIRMKTLQLPFLPSSAESENSTSFMFSINENFSLQSFYILLLPIT